MNREQGVRATGRLENLPYCVRFQFLLVLVLVLVLGFSWNFEGDDDENEDEADWNPRSNFRGCRI